MRKPLLVLKILLFSCLMFSPIACFASVREESVSYARMTLDSIIFWLAIAPAILNLILVLVSLYLMFDGVRRWGTNTSGAFSRSLIGLFMLHTSNLEISFLPYLALFLEIWLCARGFEARTAARLNAEKETAGAANALVENAKELNKEAPTTHINGNALFAQTERSFNWKSAEAPLRINMSAENWSTETALALQLDALFSPEGTAYDITAIAEKLCPFANGHEKLDTKELHAVLNAEVLRDEMAHAAHAA